MHRLHQPGYQRCFFSKSTQHGFMQRFEQHMLQKHLAILSLQPCHDADTFSECLTQQNDLASVYAGTLMRHEKK